MLRTRDARRRRPLGGFIGLVAAATVAAAVAAPSALANANPVCPNVTVSVASGGSIQLSPSCTDSDGPSALTYQVVSGPSHGSLSPTAIYTPTIGFTGDDSLTYRAFDGADYSNTATVTFHVGTSPPPPPPGQVTGQTVNATATPDTQSSSSFGGTSLELGWDTTYTGGFNPTISQAQIHFDNDFAFDATGLAQCDQTLITPLDTAQALAACPGAEVGSGSLTVTGSSTTLTGVITAFNGVPSGGDPVILLHVSVSSGAVIVVLPATLQPSSLGGDFGTEMDITSWPNTPGLATTHLDLTLDNRGPGHHFVSARCNDGDQTWNFAGDFSFHDSSTLSATSTKPCHTGAPDSDGDGIADAVDADPGASSNAFDDGSGTSGSITDRAGLSVTIKDASGPSKGVHVSVGAGTGDVAIDACGKTTLFAAGTEADLTCGSIILDVMQGEVKVVSPLTVISIPAGASSEVSDNGDGTYNVQNLGGGDVRVTVNGVTSTVAPGTSATVLVVYSFGGFFAPVSNRPDLNSAKAGQAIPVKFSLHGNQGLGILANGYPKSDQIACNSTADINEIDSTATPGASDLSYSPGADQYTYVWKTQKAWAGTCRQFVVKLNDGTTHRANFSFK